MNRPQRRIACALAGLLATPAAALAVCGGKWNRRRVALSCAAGAFWLAAYAFVASRPWPPAVYASILAALNAAVSVGLESLSPPPPERRPPLFPIEPAAVFLAAALAYGVGVLAAATVSMVVRMSQWEATRLLGPEVFLWALPALLVGAAVGAYWSRRAGPAAGRFAVSSLLAGALAYAGVTICMLIALKALTAWGVAFATFADQSYDWRMWAAAGASVLTLSACAAWSGAAPSVGRSLFRVAGSSLIWLAFTVNLLVMRGHHAEWHLRRADSLYMDPSPARQWEGIERLRTILAFNPRIPVRAYLLWDIAVEAAATGRDREAEEALRALCGLPEDALGQEFISRGRELLKDHADGLARRPQEPAGVFAVERTEYLSPDWRAVVGLWRTALLGEKTTATLTRLQRLSRSEKRIQLPRLEGWASLAAYSSLYGAPVSVGPRSLEGVRDLLDAGRPVLIRQGNRFLLVVGHTPAWRAFRYLDYREERPWLAAEMARADAAAAVSDDEAPRLERLARLQRNVVDTMPEGELARALSDSQGLCAWPDPAEARPEPSLAAWLAGEADMEADDPVGALERYGRAADLKRGDWLSPYVAAAALAAERDHRDIEARRLASDPASSAFGAWRGGNRRGWAAEAEAALASADARRLPSPVLRRLTRLLERRDPRERGLLGAAIAELAARFPSDPAAVEDLAEWRRQTGDDKGWRAASLSLRSMKPGDQGPLLDAVEASLRLRDPGTAARLIARVNPFDPRARGRRLALQGRLELQTGRPRGALALLEGALQADHSDPVSHRYFAEALDALGRREEAARHWRWVLQTGLDQADLEPARRRAGTGP